MFQDCADILTPRLIVRSNTAIYGGIPATTSDVLEAGPKPRSGAVAVASLAPALRW